MFYNRKKLLLMASTMYYNKSHSLVKDSTSYGIKELVGTEKLFLKLRATNNDNLMSFCGKNSPM